MKVVLINPPTFATATTLAQESVPPLGLAYVAAATRAAGHEVVVVDAVGSALGQHRLYRPIPGTLLTGLSVPEIAARIPEDAGVIGVSCMFSNAWPPVRDLLQSLRLAFPTAFVVLGGEHATACADFVLRTCAAVDACVLGEGEAAFVALLRALEAGDDPAGVPGVAARGRDGKGATGTGCPGSGRAARIADLASIAAPDWEAFPLEGYLAGQRVHGVVRGRTMPILASRGCPHRCSFCSSPAMWTTRWAARDPASVVDEMRACVDRYHVNDFAFYDLTALSSRGWTIEFCQRLVQADLGVTWQLPSGTRTEAMDEEVCRLMHRAGCRNLNFAPESGSPRILDRIRKRVDLPAMLQVMKAAVAAGLAVKVNIVLGFPDETPADIAQSFALIARYAAIGAEAVSVFPFVPYPGSELHRELVASGRIHMDDAYFANLVYTDPGRVESYCKRLGSAPLNALVLLGNLLFLAVQAGTHPGRVSDLVMQVLRREQSSKLANALEPMRRRREAYRRLVRTRDP